MTSRRRISGFIGFSLALLATLGLLLTAPQPAGAQSLEDGLPQGTTLVAASPADPAVAYAAAGLTLYVSRDGGATWQVASTLPSIVTALQPANRDAALVYVGTQSSGVFRSYNGGQSWQAINDGLG